MDTLYSYGSSWRYTTVITPWYVYVKLPTVNYWSMLIHDKDSKLSLIL